ncbi:MAG: MBL fold metallo-hydrolase [Deltaproteobacteria bacterium]|nr:MBL fold metallo-hydrolase [Deltaproteobacteria bacterium]MCB9787251.1 MBL fold metallo-hydrolase [Deltaproteobacteria bacterium]
MADREQAFLIRFWGVRGSIPTPGPETVRYGGNTTCIEVRCDDVTLMIDSGTGARRFGRRLLRDQPTGTVRIALIFSHLHLDHVQGFPFFAPIYEARTHLDIYSATPAESTTQGALDSQMAYPSFPIGLANLAAKLEFHTVERDGSFEVGGVRVSTCPLSHPGGSMAIRIDHRGKSFVQASDIEHGDGPAPELVALSRGADFLSYDTTYVDGEEYERHRGWGHSTWREGLAVARAAGVKRFIAFHHEPSHDDAFMDRVAAELRAADPNAVVAVEGMTIDMLTGDVSYEAREPETS